MIQIQGRDQFKRAAERAQQERLDVRRFEAGAYSVVNKSKSPMTSYIVRFSRVDGRVFGQCDCPAGTPTDRRRAPLPCKHLFASIIVHNGLNAMRRAAATKAEPVPVFDDTDDPNMMEANY
jgi:hypothetical protein